MSGRRISYGDDPSQYGELFLPAGDPRGIVVVLHGGFWKADYDAGLGRPLAASLAEHGWATWNLEYRRVGNGGGTPATFDDVAAGVDKLTDLGLDLTTVVTLGHSAGGHLAAWVAGHSGLVTGVIAQAGVLDLRAAYDEGLGGGAVEALLGHRPGPADERYDPVARAPLDLPVWCVHGTDDDDVPITQSESYVEASGGAAELVRVDGDHFVVIDPTSAAWRQTLAILDRLTS
ncbi:MAG: alpha/beta hydrolase [Actinomycetota bacterium]|nr:alpha/beta hydrolase [Actinomycetota bacterium]